MKGHYYKSIITEHRGEGNTELECQCGMRIYCVGLVRALNLHAEHVQEIQQTATVEGAQLERAVN